jgi:hypothetical protein
MKRLFIIRGKRRGEEEKSIVYNIDRHKRPIGRARHVIIIYNNIIQYIILIDTFKER